jgi:hypothetical protein
VAGIQATLLHALPGHVLAGGDEVVALSLGSPTGLATVFGRLGAVRPDGERRSARRARQVSTRTIAKLIGHSEAPPSSVAPPDVDRIAGAIARPQFTTAGVA